MSGGGFRTYMEILDTLNISRYYIRTHFTIAEKAKIFQYSLDF